MESRTAGAHPGDVQLVTFTPLPPVSGRVTACAGVVEVVDDGRTDRVLPDRRRIYRVRSVVTGAQCWAYLSELTVELVA